jgi:hypothetical protein
MFSLFPSSLRPRASEDEPEVKFRFVAEELASEQNGDWRRIYSPFV